MPINLNKLRDIPVQTSTKGFNACPKIIEMLNDNPSVTVEQIALETNLSTYCAVKWRKEILLAAKDFETWEDYLNEGRPYSPGKKILKKGKKK